MSREQFFIRNVSIHAVGFGDMENAPTLSIGQHYDLLNFATRDDILQSLDLLNALLRQWVKVDHVQDNVTTTFDNTNAASFGQSVIANNIANPETLDQVLTAGNTSTQTATFGSLGCAAISSTAIPDGIDFAWSLADDGSFQTTGSGGGGIGSDSNGNLTANTITAGPGVTVLGNDGSCYFANGNALIGFDGTITLSGGNLNMGNGAITATTDLEFADSSTAATIQGGSNHGLKILTTSVQLMAFYGATPVAQQIGGAATGGSSYTTNEQNMLNAVYSALRAYGLLT